MDQLAVGLHMGIDQELWKIKCIVEADEEVKLCCDDSDMLITRTVQYCIEHLM